MDFGEVSSFIISAIRNKESNLPTCPTINYIRENTSAYIRMQEQFYNPQVHRALSCLLHSAIENFTTSRVETPKETARDLASVIRRFFNNERDIIKRLDIRTVSATQDTELYVKQVNELLIESYVGIVLLNDFRGITSSFKYIYGMVNCDIPQRNNEGELINVCSTSGSTPYLIEESLSTTTSLRDILSSLPNDIFGIRAVKSITLQLFVALQYAAIKGVSNFPMDINIRNVDPNSALPVHIDDKDKYIITYGYIPIFERYHTVALTINNKLYGVPKSLQREQEDIYDFILTMLSITNPNLNKIFPQDRILSEDFFSEIIKDSLYNEKILMCENDTLCESMQNFIRYFSLPYARLDVYIRSGVQRIDYLRSMLKVAENLDERFLISGVMIEYAQLLDKMAEQISLENRDKLFPPERYFQFGITRDRYIDISNNIIKPDLIFVRESLSHNHITYQNADYIRQSIDKAVEKGLNFASTQKELPLADVSSEQNILASIHSIRDLITYINYYSTTNALIEKYREYIGDYNFDLSEAIQEAQFLKERYDNLFVMNPGVIGKFINNVDGNEEFIIAHLYDTFVEDLPDFLETSLQTFISRKNSTELNDLYNILYQEKLVASDPIPLIISSNTARKVSPLAQ